MKRFTPSFLAALLLAIASVTYAQSFEGTVSMSVRVPMMGDKAIPVEMQIKGDNIHSVMDGGPMGGMEMYVNNKEKKTYMIMKAMKTGYEIDMAEMEKRPKDTTKIVPEPTGKKDIISGFDCELFICKTKNGNDMELWVTRNLSDGIRMAIMKSMENGMKGGFGGQAGPFTDLLKQGYAPVRTTFKKGADVQMEMTVLKFEPKSLSDDLFKVPSDVKITKMDPSKMGGMGGPGKQ
jgi:hypothetical protein